MNQDLQVPPQGTPEYDQFMRLHFGENYEYGFRAQFGIRFAAYIIDVMLIFIVSLIIGYFLGYNNEIITKGYTAFMDPQFSKGFSKNIAPISLILTIVYVAMEIGMATSFGKMILGLQIASHTREDADTNQLIIRTSLKHFSIIFVAIPLFIKDIPTSTELILSSLNSIYALLFTVSCLFAFGIKRQALHDILAKTAIYKKSNILINE